MAQAKTKISRIKILERKHTGKIRPHRHTSYGALLLILIVVFMPLAVISRTAYAENDSFQPHTYAVAAVVPSAIPSAPSITNLSNGQVFNSNQPVTVSGNCPANTQVEVFKNQVMAGSAGCKSGGFSMAIDLFIGSNVIVSQAFNADFIGGPQSSPITVTLLPPGTLLQGSSQYNAPGAAANQFYIAAQNYFLGGKTSKTINWDLVIHGGTAPYTVVVGWGDGKTDTLVQNTAGKFTISHNYSQAAGSKGSYPITIRATDQAGSASYLQLIAAVDNSKLAGLNALLGNGYGSSPVLRLAWQLLAGAIIAVLAFWLGEKREIRLLKRV